MLVRIHIYIILCVRAACLVLFAVCQRSSFTRPGEAGKKMLPRLKPRPLPESECKGTPTFRTGKIFRQLFFKVFEFFPFLRC